MNDYMGSIKGDIYDNATTEELQETATATEEYIELFLVTLLLLNYKRGKQGLPKSKRSSVIIPPSVTDKKTKSVMIACGLNHVVLLTEGGEVYSWGKNEHGQLGINGNQPQSQLLPCYLNSLRKKRISFIACGGDHSLAVSGKFIENFWKILRKFLR